MIEWNDSLSIGIDDIDKQHKELTRRFNKFSDAVSQRYTKEALYEFLLFLKAYAMTHFETEENLMKSVNYPEYDKHIAMHKEFLGKHFWMHEGFRLGDYGVSQEVADFIEHWIVGHVSVEDKKIGEYMAKASSH